MSVDPNRETLRDLNRHVTELHRLLLERERRVYEARHGAIPPARVFHLILNDERFAWLRSLSRVMATVDEIVEGEDSIEARDVQAVREELFRLLKSADTDTFQEKYREALQESPDVVMAHAAVSAALRVAQ